MSHKPLMLWKKMCAALALLVCLSWQIGCSKDRPTFYATGTEYIKLEQGQTFLAPRPMTLATESVIQRKDEQIIDLLKVNEQLVRELQYERSK